MYIFSTIEGINKIWRPQQSHAPQRRQHFITPIASCKRLSKILHMFGHTVRHTLGRKSSDENQTDGHGCPTLSLVQYVYILDDRRDKQNMEAPAKSCTAKEATFYNANSIMQKAIKNFTHVRPHSQTHIGSKVIS